MRLTELRGPEDLAATHEAWRHRVATLLRHGSATLDRMADGLARLRSRKQHPELEFYAEAGAPEGALYVDGQLFGTLPVARL